MYSVVNFMYECMIVDAEAVTYPNRYLMIATSGGLNQQRTGVIFFHAYA